MQPSDMPLTRMTGVRLLFRARLREFGTEVRRQEDSLRALYPWLTKAFRAAGRPAPGANDNTSV